MKRKCVNVFQGWYDLAELDTVHEIEYFPGRKYELWYILSDSRYLNQALEEVDDKKPLALDFEWLCTKRADESPIDLIQIASSKFCLCIQVHEDTYPEALARFFKTHKFYGKGVNNDKIRFFNVFGFHLEEEDIEWTRLRPHGLSVNFYKMVEELVGSPVMEFKMREITFSGWNDIPLDNIQLYYAGFDAIAIMESFNEVNRRFPVSLEKEC